MNSRHVPTQAGDLDRLDHVVQLLQEEWSRHGHVELEHFWTEQRRAQPLGSVDAIGHLVEVIKADLRCRFDQGQTPTVAAYLEQFPELRRADTRILSLIYEEFCLSEERGHAPDAESFCDRYPDWKDSLASQLKYHRLISKAAGFRPSLPPFPDPGDDFEEFHLESLLGTGGTSRVFLARDNSLGGKQVVLKISSDRGQEPKAQGPLDHPHIVPVNSVTFQTERQLRGLSMPYRVGLPLDEVIKRINPVSQPRKAMALWDALVDGTRDRASMRNSEKPEPIHVGARRPGPRGDGWEGFPVRGTYAQGVAWIVMIVARALHYAHGMRTFHRDVKPANVLLTIQHGPQLLDFNLADSPHSAHQAQAALHGGTLPYMAPEQIEAFLDPELWGKVEAKADIYSLGLVFRELLTGQMPELPPETLTPQRALRNVLDRRPFLDVSVRRFNSTIPHALEAIVAKCLTLSPEDRYPDARALAHDLDRFLKYQSPLKAANPSRREKLANWATRHRRPFVGSFACLIAFVALLYYPPINECLQKPIETVRTFQSAIDYLDEGEFKLSLDLLRQLERDYPRSSLLRIYLAFAWDGEKNPIKAESHFTQALEDEQIDDRLADWQKDHPDVVDFLEDFAETRFKRASNLAVTDVDRKIAEGEEEDEKVREPYYRMAREALRLAEKLNSDSQRTQRLLAKAEDFDREFSSANDRITRSIDLADSVPNQAVALVNNKHINNLIFSLSLRCQIETRWAESLRAQGPSQGTPDPFDLMKKAVKDLERVDRLLLGSNAESQSVKERELLESKLKAMLTLGEIELDRDLIADADGHLKHAKKCIADLITHAKKTSLPVPNVTKVNQRWSKDHSRLETLRSRQTKRPDARPDKAGAKDRVDDSRPA